ncbi:cell envelope integrity protein TolA [Shimia sp. MMG029]|uniref:cell envelope integrity protein TolA n=1 Tax=Shimia sp. MMG029 TaxID=3021978 RepID=UPI0022FF1072|nr:energy transducer TonB [Shimia sp. MMG029]MDA5559081.1 energy transducer TonB [Shimia sp. MMG029]
MIKTSKTIAMLTFLTAVGLHSAYFVGRYSTDDVDTAGGAPQVTASLGSSFADLAAGNKVPHRPDVKHSDEWVDEAEAPRPETLENSKNVGWIEPQTQRVAAPSRNVTKTEQPEVLPTHRPVADASPTQTKSTIAPVKLPTKEPEASSVSQPSKSSKVTVPPKVVTLKPIERGVADRRPKKPTEKKKQTKKSEQKRANVAAGNASTNARKGTQTGKENQKAATSSKVKGKSQASGNAALSNYKGKVYRKIARAKRGKSNIRGTARVSVSISATGQLSGLRISKSSGSARLDNTALSQVKRAAPFPAPPDGQPKSYVISIKGS